MLTVTGLKGVSASHNLALATREGEAKLSLEWQGLLAVNSTQNERAGILLSLHHTGETQLQAQSGEILFHASRVHRAGKRVGAVLVGDHQLRQVQLEVEG